MIQHPQRVICFDPLQFGSCCVFLSHDLSGWDFSFMDFKVAIACDLLWFHPPLLQHPWLSHKRILTWSVVRTWPKNRILSAREKTPRKQESCDLGFFKTQNCCWNVLLCPSQVQQTEVGLLQIIQYNWLLLFVYVPLWKNMFLSTCPCDWTLYLCDSF